MIITIILILNNTGPNINPKTAAIGVLLAILIHLVLFILYVKFTRESRHSNKNRKGEYIGLGILTIFFGLIYVDGAIAFVSHENTLLISILMFASVLCDLTASIMIITLFFLKPQKVNLFYQK